MLRRPALKITFRIALVTAGVAVLYQLANLLLVYHYFSYEYGMLAAAVIALGAGMLLMRPRKQKSDPLDTLTAKELQILALIHQGKTNKEIAAINFVEVTTVKTHVNNLYAKLGVNDRKTAAKLYALHADIPKSSFSPPPESA